MAETFRFKNKRGDVIKTQNKGYARQLRQDENFTEVKSGAASPAPRTDDK